MLVLAAATPGVELVCVCVCGLWTLRIVLNRVTLWKFAYFIGK